MEIWGICFSHYIRVDRVSTQHEGQSYQTVQSRVIHSHRQESGQRQCRYQVDMNKRIYYANIDNNETMYNLT